MIAYYYCSLETCLNILRNKELYLSDPLKMNDKAEITWGIKRVMENYENTKAEDDFREKMSEVNLDFTSEDMIKRIEERGQRNLYIISFSKNKDLLSQWRAYAKNGTGVAIGFDLDKLKLADNINVRDVDYSDRIVPDKNVDDIVRASSVIANLDLPVDTQLDILIDRLLSSMVVYKNPAFKEEDEVRLVYGDEFILEELIRPEGYERIDLKREFRLIGENSITEFVKLPFESDAISEICIGPKCMMNENDMKAMAKHYLGTTPQISSSTATYR